MYKNFFKRLIDILISVIVFAALFPIFLIITVLFWIVNGGHPFFVQSRPGKSNKFFCLVKFKTMNDKKDSSGNLLSDSERLTYIGKFVRRTSLDELPQLLNVIKGDMSLVGPRPLLIEYLTLYNHTQKRRHEVRPGITGWAQVNGRNGIGWQKKFELDVWYVDHLNFGLDIKILFLTLKKVITREGISQEGQATMEYFKGNN